MKPMTYDKLHILFLAALIVLGVSLVIITRDDDTIVDNQDAIIEEIRTVCTPKAN